MKHLSLVKIFVALLICSVYIFCCAVTGTVKSIDNDVSPQTSAPSSDNADKLGGTVDFIVDAGTQGDVSSATSAESTPTSSVAIENLHFARPNFADNRVASSYRPTSAVLELTNKSSSSSEESSSSEDEPTYSEQSSSSRPAESSSSSSSSSSSTVESSSSTSSTTSEETSSTTSDGETSEPAELPNDDPNGEILRVTNGDTEVSGNAVDIITQIVENEIGSTFAPEAIKAQAVTAYTYVKYSNLHGKAPYCILKESTNDSVRTLVKSVIGEGIYYQGELIQAVYSASSAGCTASSKNVWGGNIPYLQSVYCELDEKYDPNYGIKKTFSLSEMKDYIKNNANIELSGDPSEWFVIQNHLEGKYVGDMMIGGNEYFVDNDGDKLRITGRRFREIIMDYDIRSSAFDIEYNAEKEQFTVTTYGYGHGVGLSQNGANNLAKYWGWDYKQILTFYFQGTDVY